MKLVLMYHYTSQDFSPYYELKNVPPTAVADLEKAYKIAKDAGMKYVYIGNVPSGTGENTYCHSCGEVLIERDGFQVMADSVKTDKKCPKCGT